MIFSARTDLNDVRFIAQDIVYLTRKLGSQLRLLVELKI